MALNRKTLTVTMVGIGLALIIFDVIFGRKCERDKRAEQVEGGRLSLLDVQFGADPSNNPSVIYRDMFTRGSPWVGGFTLGDGRTKTYSAT
jgi:hypothetical protein